MGKVGVTHLKRQVGVTGAIFLGLGSILGTGIFVSIGLVAGVSGPTALIAVFLAGLLALCNAYSSAQLAANYPTSGGSFEFGYQLISGTAGFTAGWMFLVAKSASAATAALGVSGYSLGLMGWYRETWLIPLTIIVIVLVTAIVASGIRRTNMVNIVVVGITLLSLGMFVVGGIPLFLEKGFTHWTPFWQYDDLSGSAIISGMFHATALMFVAYTGYGRVATLGEEITEPRKNLPKAIRITLAVTVLIYAAVLIIAISTVGHHALYDAARGDTATLSAAAGQFGFPGSALLVGVGAVTAMLGVLLNLILGLSRMVLAMSRRGHLPSVFTRIDSTTSTPIAAVVLIGGVVLLLSLLGDVYVTWSLSAFTVLIYYGITNWAAILLPAGQRMYPEIFAWAGLAGCLFLAFWVEPVFWFWGLTLLLAGFIWYYFTK